ncbi:IclR family transcriptional regulator [Streptomyces sp. NPDC058486]|uniref:IclR family transcriptional regulator n=1 Tax=unclassified Streptomyces TaxID=2593676 RepID=UPI003662A8A7
MSSAPPASDPKTLIHSVQRALRLLRILEERGGHATAKQLARAAELPLPTAYHLLRTLAHERVVSKERRTYALTGIPERYTASEAPMPLQGWVDHLSLDLDAAVYFATYQEGEIRVSNVSRNPERPPVEEWADFGATGHAHALGRAILAHLDPEARADHLSRHPVTALTRFTVPGRTAFDRLIAVSGPRTPVLEQQEYALGTVCAAVPITVGSSVAALALSLPSARAQELKPLAERLQTRAENVLLGLHFSIRPA